MSGATDRAEFPVGDRPLPLVSTWATNALAMPTDTENGEVEAWEMREWYGAYLDACNRHDLEAVRSFVDPSVRRAHLPGGADAWLADMADLFDAFPDWRWRRIQLIVEDDRLAAHLRASGTHLGSFRGIAPTRRRANVAEFAMYRVESGRIAEFSGTAATSSCSLGSGDSAPRAGTA